jgi:hypothetical protein
LPAIALGRGVLAQFDMKHRVIPQQRLQGEVRAEIPPSRRGQIEVPAAPSKADMSEAGRRPREVMHLEGLAPIEAHGLDGQHQIDMHAVVASEDCDRLLARARRSRLCRQTGENQRQRAIDNGRGEKDGANAPEPPRHYSASALKSSIRVLMRPESDWSMTWRANLAEAR